MVLVYNSLTKSDKWRAWSRVRSLVSNRKETQLDTIRVNELYQFFRIKKIQRFK